jgi:hypothetical protein
MKITAATPQGVLDLYNDDVSLFHESGGLAPQGVSPCPALNAPRSLTPLTLRCRYSLYR